ncbi:MAG: hypothetical protein ABIQ40_14435 [Bacteroidia bacterium]
MKKLLLKSTVFVLTMTALVSFDRAHGWFAAGSKPKSYEMGIEKGSGQDGKNAATIKSKDRHIKGFGTYMQMSKPDKFLGKRVRMSGYVKSQNVKAWAGLWFRVDKANSNVSLAFDNMSRRAIKGTTEWTKYEIVLNVPSNASALAYGALLNGTGQIWFDQVNFEVVDSTFATTGGEKSETLLQEVPSNLDFEH